jgi:hypothetical protein
MNNNQSPDECDEFVTIIGATMADITAEFAAQKLSERNFSIVHKVGRHHFTKVAGNGSESLFGGQPMIAATFARRVYRRA